MIDGGHGPAAKFAMTTRLAAGPCARTNYVNERQTDAVSGCGRRQPVDATPVWLMRQAGRYMAEYRALRERYTILELIKTPELACEVTMQPIQAFDLDAAIIFADILPPLEGMGLGLEFVKGEGPLIHNPMRTPADVDSLAGGAAAGDAGLYAGGDPAGAARAREP